MLTVDCDDAVGAACTGSVAAGTLLPPGGSVPVFAKNVSSFDFHADIALPADGSARSFGVAIIVDHPPVAGESIPGGAAAFLSVNVSAVRGADATRFVSMSLCADATCFEPKDKHGLPVGPMFYNFTLPAAASVGTIDVRVLADSTLIETFVANGRGVITLTTLVHPNGGAGLYLVGGHATGHGPGAGSGADGDAISGGISISNASAWSMCNGQQQPDI